MKLGLGREHHLDRRSRPAPALRTAEHLGTLAERHRPSRALRTLNPRRISPDARGLPRTLLLGPSALPARGEHRLEKDALLPVPGARFARPTGFVRGSAFHVQKRTRALRPRTGLRRRSRPCRQKLPWTEVHPPVSRADLCFPRRLGSPRRRRPPRLGRDAGAAERARARRRPRPPRPPRPAPPPRTSRPAARPTADRRPRCPPGPGGTGGPPGGPPPRRGA